MENKETPLCKNEKLDTWKRLTIPTLGLSAYLLSMSSIPTLTSTVEEHPTNYSDVYQEDNMDRIMEIICSNTIEEEEKDKEEEREFLSSLEIRGKYTPRNRKRSIHEEDKLQAEKEEEEKEAELRDKIDAVETFFEDFTGKEGLKTPMQGYEKQIVELADEYEIDYKYIIAIAMKESRLGTDGGEEKTGKPFRPYNAWGLMVDRDRFSSWEEGIEGFCDIFRKYYIDQGLTTPHEIAPKYCPPNPQSWARDVASFKSYISTYEDK